MAESPTLYASGTTAQSISSTPTVIAAITAAGLYTIHFDFTLSAAGDYTQILLYRTILSGGNSVCEGLLDVIEGAIVAPQSVARSYSGQATDGFAASPGAPLSFEIVQLFGTARAFPYKILAM